MLINNLNESFRYLFIKSLIETYIQRSQLVGARNLASDSRLDVSTATVCNAVVDLEYLVLIISRHTSCHIRGNSHSLGLLGVIGSTRMAYERVISIVDVMQNY